MSTPRDPLLTIAHDLIENEARIKNLRFYRRLLLVALLIGVPILVTLTVLGNVLIDFSQPGTGRPWLNVLGFGLSLLLTIGLSIVILYRREQIERLRTEAAKARETRKTLLADDGSERIGVHKRYREDVLSTIGNYRQEASQYRRTHNIFQGVVIVGAIATTSAASAIGEASWVRWIAVGISLSVGVSAGFTGYYKFRERAMNLQRTADDIEREYNAVQLGIFEYRRLKEEEALEAFAERVERLKEEQRKREQQLEQPPEGRAVEST